MKVLTGEKHIKSPAIGHLQTLNWAGSTAEAAQGPRAGLSASPKGWLTPIDLHSCTDWTELSTKRA
eukprot:1158293-Pelagomonas_calceolata.AAC.7